MASGWADHATYRAPVFGSEAITGGCSCCWLPGSITWCAENVFPRSVELTWNSSRTGLGWPVGGTGHTRVQVTTCTTPSGVTVSHGKSPPRESLTSTGIDHVSPPSVDAATIVLSFSWTVGLPKFP